MTQRLQSLTPAELVERFVAIGVEQDEANLDGEYCEINRLYRQMVVLRDELKVRPGDQRSALTALYTHSNMQVRLNAAKSMLAVAPVAARLQLQAIADSKHYPQAGDAGMSLFNLDRGIFKPT